MNKSINCIRTTVVRAGVVAFGLAQLACGGSGGDARNSTNDAAASGGGAATSLSAFQLENGIGPITEVVTLPAAVDEKMAEHGEEVFNQKCAACHKLEERYVGPALGKVLERRSPAFVMNMILNPQDMIEQHPVTKQLLAEFMSFMPNQNLTQDEARAVLEYIRSEDH